MTANAGLARLAQLHGQQTVFRDNDDVRRHASTEAIQAVASTCIADSNRPGEEVTVWGLAERHPVGIVAQQFDGDRIGEAAVRWRFENEEDIIAAKRSHERPARWPFP